MLKQLFVHSLRMTDGRTHQLSHEEKDVLVDWIDDLERMTLKAKAATSPCPSRGASEDEFIVIEDLDAIRREF